MHPMWSMGPLCSIIIHDHRMCRATAHNRSDRMVDRSPLQSFQHAPDRSSTTISSIGLDHSYCAPVSSDVVSIGTPRRRMVSWTLRDSLPASYKLECVAFLEFEWSSFKCNNSSFWTSLRKLLSLHPCCIQSIFFRPIEHAAITFIQISSTESSLSEAFSSSAKPQQMINAFHLFIVYVFTFLLYFFMIFLLYPTFLCVCLIFLFK